MRFFENTRKPQGFGGKLMTKTSAVAAEQILRFGLIDVEMAT